jgi:hypothetical protein
MNNYAKLTDGTWGVRCDDDDVEPGDTVTVTKKNGATKHEVIGAIVKRDRYGVIATIAGPPTSGSYAPVTPPARRAPLALVPALAQGPVTLTVAATPPPAPPTTAVALAQIMAGLNSAVVTLDALAADAVQQTVRERLIEALVLACSDVAYLQSTVAAAAVVILPPVLGTRREDVVTDVEHADVEERAAIVAEPPATETVIDF